MMHADADADDADADADADEVVDMTVSAWSITMCSTFFFVVK